MRLIKRTINDCRKQPVQQTNENEEEKPEISTIVLPYAGTQGESISRDINKTLNKIFEKKVKARIAFRSKKTEIVFSNQG